MYFIGSSEEASLVVTSDITAVADGDLDTVWAERIVSDYDTTIKLDLDKPGQVCKLIEVRLACESTTFLFFCVVSVIMTQRCPCITRSLPRQLLQLFC